MCTFVKNKIDLNAQSKFDLNVTIKKYYNYYCCLLLHNDSKRNKRRR